MTKETIQKNLEFAKGGYFDYKPYEIDLMEKALASTKQVTLKDWIKIEVSNKDFNLDVDTLDDELFVIAETEKAVKVLVLKKWVNSNADATYRYWTIWAPKSQTVTC